MAQIRDRSYTEPQYSIQTTKDPIPSAGAAHYSKQISSPASSSPSTHKDSYNHSPGFPSPGYATMAVHGQKNVKAAAGFGHQESEYEEMEVQGVTDLLSDRALLQVQSKRYQEIEMAMNKRTPGLFVSLGVCVKVLYTRDILEHLPRSKSLSPEIHIGIFDV